MTIPSNQQHAFAQPSACHLTGKPGSGVAMSRHTTAQNFHPYSGYPSPQQQYGSVSNQSMSSAASFHPLTSPAIPSGHGAHYMITPAHSPIVGESPHNPAADSFETFKNLLTQSFPEIANMDQESMPPPPTALFIEDDVRQQSESHANMDLVDEFQANHRQPTPVNMTQNLLHPTIVDEMMMSPQYFGSSGYQHRYTLPLQQHMYPSASGIGINSHPAAFMAAHQAGSYPMNTSIMPNYARTNLMTRAPLMQQALHAHPYNDLVNDSYSRAQMFAQSYSHMPTQNAQDKSQADDLQRKQLTRPSDQINDISNVRRPAVKPITIDFTNTPHSEPSPPPTPLTPEEEEQRTLAKILERPNPVSRPMNPAELATVPRFKCACTKQFQKLCGLKSHVKVHQSQGERLRYNAEGDLEWYNSEGKVVTANPQDLVRSHICDHCKRSFLRRQDLRRHLVSAHSDNVKKLHCPNCDATFSRSDALYRHIHSNRCRV